MKTRLWTIAVQEEHPPGLPAGEVQVEKGIDDAPQQENV